MGFRFERDLPHQTRAVESIAQIYKNLPIEYKEDYLKNYANPFIAHINSLQYGKNLLDVMQLNGIPLQPKQSDIIDVMMETGTGKTYTYTKTMFELNKRYGITKFVIIVPTLSIKAGTINFLRSEGAREHFRDEYGKSINLYVVESKKSSKSKKEYMPTSVKSFVETMNSPNTIEVLLINMGMLNSDTMSKKYDRTLFDKFDTPFDAIASVNPFVIIDEPHRFSQTNKTWENIKKLKPQAIIRFGATFTEYENLVYTLTAAEAFNQNLVKGVIGYVEKSEAGKDALVRLIDLDGKEAKFEVIEGKKKFTKILARKDSLGMLHPEIGDLFIEKLNKSEVILSNGMSLRKKDKFNPYMFSETLEEIMIKNAIKNHFEIEKELLDDRALSDLPKIKPLTLFFIDNIEEYRSEKGKLKIFVEKTIAHYTKEALKDAKSDFYKEYLKKSLQNISTTHGGYFSKDNQEKDEAIEQEISEILHDKEKLLSLENPRKFIFSKWTLKEGWDNPNVFQICKLRSSGSEISKLQEVGRGLRLPVNEHMAREKGEFYLHYFVDFTEEDFVEKLIEEINSKSAIFVEEKEPEKLEEDVVKTISLLYGENEDDIWDKLEDQGIIRGASRKFKENGYKKLQELYPKAFIQRVGKDKIRKAEERTKRKVKARVGKYDELKELWEKLNEKVVLEYKIKDEKEFQKLLYDFFVENKKSFSTNTVTTEAKKIEINGGQATQTVYKITEELSAIKTMSYKTFLVRVAQECKINIETFHNVFVKLKKEGILDISDYLNHTTISAIKRGFDNYLLANSVSKLSVAYKKIGASIHPTKLTDNNGNPLPEVNASDIGTQYSDEQVAKSYYFEELFFDSELEKENIRYDDYRIIVFTKIPKNSIKIPVPGGKSYSPDFAYVIKNNGETKEIHFVVETKDKEGKDLSQEEKIKMELGGIFLHKTINIVFVQQLKNTKIKEIFHHMSF